MGRRLNKVFSPAVKFVFALVLGGGFGSGCTQIKEAGRTIGHTTRDVTREIGHGTRDVVRELGAGGRDESKPADEQVKTVVKPAPVRSEY